MRPRLEVRLRNSPVDSSGSFPARSRERIQRKNQHQQGGAQSQEDRHQQAVAAGLEDPQDHKQHAEGRKDRPDGVEGAGRIRRQGIHELAAEQDDHGDDRGLEQERGSPADRGGDQAPDQRAGRGADAAHPADAAERPGARLQIGEQQRGEDVDRRDQQGRADAFQDRVAEDQDAEPGGNGAQQRADAVHDEPHDEAALAAPAVRQLAARDHQGRHDQQEQRDRGLHPLDGGVQVGADVVDHHVHVGTGEAADELGKGEGDQQPPRGDGRPCQVQVLGHVAPLHVQTQPSSGCRRRCSIAMDTFMTELSRTIGSCPAAPPQQGP